MIISPRRRRQLAVWWHVLSSVGWMSMAVVLFSLVVLALTTDSPALAASAITIAHHVDVVLLAPLANASAATGLALGLGTAWGLTVHRWVLAKLLITLLQLYLGIFVLSAALDDALSAAQTGAVPGASWGLALGTAAMAGAIAVQAWLSVAKPGGTIRSRRTPKSVPAPSWTLVAVVAGPMIDIVIGTSLGFPSPLFSLLVVIAAAVSRGRARRHALAGDVAAARWS